jgi:hypothetical protein
VRHRPSSWCVTAVDTAGTGAAGATNWNIGTAGATVFRTGVPTTPGAQVRTIPTQIGAAPPRAWVIHSERGARPVSRRHRRYRAPPRRRSCPRRSRSDAGTEDLSPFPTLQLCNTLTAGVIERLGGCRGDEPAYFDRMARRVRNSSARRRIWIASGKSRCIRVSG